jgi:hypothetical protein
MAPGRDTCFEGIVTYSNDTMWAEDIPDGPAGVEVWVRDPGEWDAHRAEG